jgi:hypothetical protein
MPVRGLCVFHGLLQRKFAVHFVPIGLTSGGLMKKQLSSGLTMLRVERHVLLS